MGRFEAKILAALLLAVVVPFLASLVLVRYFIEDTITVTVNDEVRSYIESSLTLYSDFFRTNKQLGDDQASRLAESPEVVAIAFEAEALLAENPAAEEASPTDDPGPSLRGPPDPAPPTPNDDETELLLLVPGDAAPPTSLEPSPQDSPAANSQARGQAQPKLPSPRDASAAEPSPNPGAAAPDALPSSRASTPSTPRETPPPKPTPTGPIQRGNSPETPAPTAPREQGSQLEASQEKTGEPRQAAPPLSGPLQSDTASPPASLPDHEPPPASGVPEESSLDTLRLSIALAQALEEARRRIGVKGEVRILDQQGKVLARLPALVPHTKEARVRHVKRDLWRPVGQAVALEIDFELSSFYFDEFQRGEQTIYPVYSEMTGSLDEIKRSFFWFYLIVLGGVVMLASFGGALFAQRLTRRVAVLIGATQRVAEGDLSVSVPVRGTDEISDLAKSFNHMVSEVKESRARVLYLERIGAWKEIARRLAHEIKNPLTPIRLAVQQVRSSYKGDDARFARLVKEADEIVDEEITSLRALVEEFSEFARLPDITLVPEDLTAFAHELCEQNPRFSEGVTLSFRQGPQMIVRLDRRALRRAVVNLLKNAAEAIAEAKGKGSVIVTTSIDAKGRAVLTVEDDGPGIPEEMREKIFEPYYTSKDHGTGLGLAIVKRTVFEHQGEVELTSREGGGAVFVLSFPCVDEN